MQPSSSSWTEVWPALPYGAWKDTCTTLHLWTQIVGKVRLAQTPWVNHSWHVTLYATPRGLTTSGIPYDGRVFEIDFDFIDHALLIRVSDGSERQLPLGPRPVADFHDQLMAALVELDIRLLTVREREVLRWTAAGRRQSEIAAIMQLSERTVENHLRNARRRLAATTTAHMVTLTIGCGEIDA